MSRMPLASDYAPYPKFPAFTQGVMAYACNSYTCPYSANSVEGQAWDRGLEYGMKINQWKAAEKLCG